MSKEIKMMALMIAKLSSDETIANLMNDFLCCDCHPDLSDDEAATGEAFFDVLTDARPELVELAQTM